MTTRNMNVVDRRQQMQTSASSFNMFFVSQSNFLQCTDFKPHFTLQSGVDGMESVLFSSDGVFLASANRNKLLLFKINQMLGISKNRVPNVVTSKLENYVTSSAFTTNNSFSIVSGDDKGYVFLHDAHR